jgi:hypothetical protein
VGIPWYAWLGAVGTVASTVIIVMPNSKAYRPCSLRLTRIIRISALAYGLLTVAYFFAESRLPGPAALTASILGFLSVIVMCMGMIAAKKTGSRPA